jgi:hypothetical protein
MKTAARSFWAAGLAFAVLTAAMTFPLVLHLSDHVASDLRDPLYSIFAMTWNARAIVTGFAGYPDANIFFPHHGTLFYGDVLPLESILGAPVLAATGNPVPAYNLVFLLSFVVSGLGMFVLVRRLTGSPPAGFLAGLIFAFFPYHFAHSAHLEILFMGWIPFFFLYVHKFFDEPTTRNALGMAAFYILQTASCVYYGEYLALFAGLTFLYFVLRDRRWRAGRVWTGLILFAAVCSAVLAPYILTFLKIHAKLLFVRSAWEAEFFSAELQHFAAVPPFNIAWGWLTGRLGAQEWQLFPGLVPLVLAGLWLVSRRRTVEPPPRRAAGEAKRGGFRLWDWVNGVLAAFCLVQGITGGFEWTLGQFEISSHDLSKPLTVLLVSIAARVLAGRRMRLRLAGFFRTIGPNETLYLGLTVIAFLLSLGPVIRMFGREIIAGPYALLYDFVPGFKNVRVPSRFAVLMMVGLSVLAGLAAAAVLARRTSTRARRAWTAAGALLVLAEYLSIPLPIVPVPVGEEIPSIYAAVKVLPAGAALVELPMPARDSEESQDALPVYFASVHRRPVVNGYSGYAPPGYRVIREAMDAFPDAATIRLLADLDVTHALVDTRGFRPDRGREIVAGLQALGPSAELLGQAEGRFLFRLPPPSGPRPARPTGPELGDRAKWKAAANKNPLWAGRALDGDPSTGWTTGYPQETGDVFDLDCGEELDIASCELALDTNPLDYPRSFRLEVSADRTAWSTVAEVSGFFPPLERSMIEDFSKYEVPVTFERTRARYLRFTLTAGHESRHWSINEIILR